MQNAAKKFFANLGIDMRLLGMIGALVLIWLTFHLATDGRFLTPRNLFNLSVQTASVAVMATGRSDYPNQINNVLAFPGIFRGALDAQASDITEGMKLAAALAIAESVTEDQLAADFIIPSVFDKSVSQRVAEAVFAAAKAEGISRL